jgi:hypothetical protein
VRWRVRWTARATAKAPDSAIEVAKIGAAATIRAAELGRLGSVYNAKVAASASVVVAVIAAGGLVLTTTVQGHYALEQAKLAIAASASAVASVPATTTEVATRLVGRLGYMNYPSPHDDHGTPPNIDCSGKPDDYSVIIGSTTWFCVRELVTISSDGLVISENSI